MAPLKTASMATLDGVSVPGLDLTRGPLACSKRLLRAGIALAVATTPQSTTLFVRAKFAMIADKLLDRVRPASNCLLVACLIKALSKVKMISRSALFLASALLLANCCAVGIGCAPPPGASIAGAPARDGLGSSLMADKEPLALRSKKRALPKHKMTPSPLEGAESRRNAKPEPTDSWEQEQAADLADEVRLKRRLLICLTC